MLRGIYTTHVKKGSDDALSDQTNVVTSDVVRYATCLPLQESSFFIQNWFNLFSLAHNFKPWPSKTTEMDFCVVFDSEYAVMQFPLLPPGVLLRVVSGCKVRALFGIQLVAMLF
ncbi:hypothetical protein CEXT_107481 [Caerostris extrusa]|uniref:Uncharacterized protein n=1 Tax=Caerostris extrusa TaxID=172846 RepID=A0AAV4XEK4_CAEEX|nr:hypothetical protein CEXT_107481 [Caerostris extrusa]